MKSLLRLTQRENLEIARESCGQLRLGINDLLEVTRLDTGNLTIEFTSVSLPGLVHRVVTTMRPAANGKNIHLGLDLELDQPEILLDEHRITQVVTNLLNNALRFTPAGGDIRLKVGEDPDRPDWVQVSLTDSGPGIAQDHLDHIFDCLHQIKNGDAATEPGIGLGMHICQELIHLHGGQIRVKTELGQGSTFTFVLPRFHRAKRSRVSVVDEVDSRRQALSQVLEGEELSMIAAEGGSIALDSRRRQTAGSGSSRTGNARGGWRENSEANQKSLGLCSSHLAHRMKKILVVEDDRSVAAALAIRLETEGYKVRIARDGIQGLISALGWNPDLILMDLFLPVGNGFSVADRLQKSASSIPVIFMTASRQSGLRDLAQALGGAGYVEKPYDSEELLRAISQALFLKNSDRAGTAIRTCAGST